MLQRLAQVTTIVAVSLEDFRTSTHALVEEAFGPLSILVEVPAGTDLAALMPEFYEGNLTGTVHLSSAEGAGDTENASELQALVAALTQQVGRVLFNGWSTGVAVTPAQHAANLSESAQYAAELAQCRESAKLDGGWPAYESCACHVDAKHGLDASAGCP